MACTELPQTPDLHNPLDPDDPGYQPPETTILSGPSGGAVLDTHAVTFSWSGNEQVDEYSYRLRGKDQDWSEWSTEMMVTYQYLEDSTYQFEVKGRYPTGEEDATPAAWDFEIDDINGPALWLSPRGNVNISGDTLTLALAVDEVQDLMAVYAVVRYDNSRLELVNYWALDGNNEFLGQNNGSAITIVEQTALSDTDFVAINLAVVGGTPVGLDGAGKIFSMTFRKKASGLTRVELTSDSRMAASNMEPIPISELAPAIVELP